MLYPNTTDVNKLKTTCQLSEEVGGIVVNTTYSTNFILENNGQFGVSGTKYFKF